jgi:hypothetical protein
MTGLKTLYDEDFVAWSKQQAEALRAAARGGSNQQLDWENLAEEIESSGKSQRSALGSQIMRIVQHLVKLQHSPAIDPRNSWRRSIRLARIQIRNLLRDNPSLKGEVSRLIGEETSSGIELAIADLDEQGEIDAAGAPALRRARFTEEQVLGDWLPEEPPR